MKHFIIALTLLTGFGLNAVFAEVSEKIDRHKSYYTPDGKGSEGVVSGSTNGGSGH